MAGALLALVMLDTFLTGYLLVQVRATKRLALHVVGEYDALSDVVDLLPCNREDGGIFEYDEVGEDE